MFSDNRKTNAEDGNGHESFEVTYGGRLGWKRKGKPPKWTTLVIYFASIGAITSWIVIIIKHLILWAK